jgi:hypothetical protein
MIMSYWASCSHGKCALSLTDTLMTPLVLRSFMIRLLPLVQREPMPHLHAVRGARVAHLQRTAIPSLPAPRWFGSRAAQCLELGFRYVRPVIVSSGRRWAKSLSSKTTTEVLPTAT